MLYDTALIQGLLCKEIPCTETFGAFNISVKAEDLLSNILGFTYVSKHQNYYIIINNNINYLTQQKVLAHEIKHIVYDMPKSSSIIGIDQQNTCIELEADKFYKHFLKTERREKSG